MIIRCQGISPDGAYGCLRPLGHDDRGQPCKNLATGVVWCSLCELYECEHVDPVDVATSIVAMEKARAFMEAMNGGAARR